MSSTATAPIAPAPALAEYREIRLSDLRPSPLNPRTHVTDVDELAASIREKGILEPLVARPAAKGYEIVAGERRWRAAKVAGLEVVPVMVRQLNDVQVLETAIAENNQRADVHPLDEAEGFSRLQQIDKTQTHEHIAATLGRTAAYVRNRLRLLTLIGEARKAFNEDKITLGHAQLLAKLPPDLQGKALRQVCFETEFDYETGKGERIVGPGRLRNLQDFIDQNVRLDIATPDAQEEFPELAADVAKATAAGATVLMLHDSYASHNAQPKPGEPLNRDDYQEVKKGAKGAVLGVFVQGRRRGKTTWVAIRERRNPAAPLAPTTSTKPKTAQQTAADKKARAAEQKRLDDAKAKREREAKVRERAAVQLAEGTTVAALQTTSALRTICDALCAGDLFDPTILDAVAKAVKLPSQAFDYGHKGRAKLPAPALAKIAAVAAVGACSFGGDGPHMAEAFKAFGVDMKAIDRAVQKEASIAAKAKATVHKLHPTKKAAKKR
jgi:ParB/RepB/Spo0J family partition protein